MTAKKKNLTKEILEVARLAEQKLLKDLSAKVSQGTAGIAEAKQIRTMIEQMETQQVPAGKMSSFIINTAKTALFFDTTSRTIQRWAEAKCPQVKRGWFDLKAVTAWWLENIFESKVDESDETIRHYRQQYEKWRSEKVRIEVETTKGNLLDHQTVVNMAVQQVRAIKGGLEALSNRLAPVLAGKSLNEIRAIIDRETRGMLENWSNSGAFIPPPYDEGNQNGSQKNRHGRDAKNAQGHAGTIPKSKDVRTKRHGLRGKKKS